MAAKSAVAFRLAHGKSEQNGMREALDAIQLALRKSEEHGKNWKALEVLTEQLTGLGYLCLGIAVPMMAAGAATLTWTSLLVNILPAAFLTWFGIVLLKTPLGLKSHFLGHEDQLYSFLRHFENSEGKPLVRQILDWADRQEINDKPVRALLRRAVLVFRIGFGLAALLVGLFLVQNLVLTFMVLWLSLGLWTAIGIEALILGLYSGLAVMLFWLKRRPTKTGASPS
jgi:hypothetical protein